MYGELCTPPPPPETLRPPVLLLHASAFGLVRSNQIEAGSKARLRRGGGGEILTTVAHAGFESPPDRSHGDRP